MTLHRSLSGILVAAGLAAGTARGARLDPALVAAVAQAPPGSSVPVLIVMREQGLSASERRALGRMPPRERRAEGLRLLAARAARAQTDLRGRLGLLRAAGAVDDVRPLRLLNGVRARVRAERLGDLLPAAGVDRILWDPPVPPEQMLDRAGSPAVRSAGSPAAFRLDPQVWWQLTAVGAPSCWALGFDGAGVVVAVLDTGIDFDHTDLSGHIFAHPGEIPDNQIDDDENGFVDDVRGWDFVDGDNDPSGSGANDHGTLVSGIVVGDGTGGIRTGVAPGATVMPLRVVGASWATIFEAIDYAIANGADVIQMSVSQKWRFDPKPDYAAWRVVADNELALGVPHANSIGNEGDNLATDPIPYNLAAPGNCPAPWRHPDQYLAGGASGITAVGAVAENGIAPDYSSRGPGAWEDIAAFNPEYPYEMPPAYRDYPWSTGLGGLTGPALCAPGPDTRSTALGGGYLPFEGTSAAAPHVAGAMAILLQADSTLTPAKMEMLLETTAVDLGEPGKDNVYGAGLLNVFAALQRVLNPGLYGTLEGRVRDAVTDSLLHGASVELPPADTLRTNSLGQFFSALPVGIASVRIDAFGYFPDTSSVAVSAGETPTIHDRWLLPRPTGMLYGTVRDARGPALPGTRIGLPDTPLAAAISDTAGVFLLGAVPADVPLTLEAVRFGHVPILQTVTVSPGETDTLDLVMTHGVWDDFELDQGWTRDPGDTAPVGVWERGDPVGTWMGASLVQPEDDVGDPGARCFLTMNCNPGATRFFSDVDAGATTLVSPVFDATGFVFPVIRYQRWYSNDTGGSVDDLFQVQVSADAGASWTTLETLSSSAAQWTERTFDLLSRTPVTAMMRIRFRASDLGGPSVVEAAVDEVYLGENPTQGVPSLDLPAAGPVLRLDPAVPNPCARGATLRFALPAAGPVRLVVYDLQGRRVRDLLRASLAAGEHASSWDGRDAAGRRCPAGVYLYRLEQAGRRAEGRLVLLR